DSLRKSDATFRYGGDEFAAICPETSGEAMAGVLRRIEMSLKNYCAQIRLTGDIGISWGAASFPTDALEAGELIEVADQRLYHCKRAHHQGLSPR
ncbi:MAG TPA: diguanylate cyclase, partial [Blastocatellia bacterium]|nr:diguanylate cyclase [Blastocatellia bacterium]